MSHAFSSSGWVAGAYVYPDNLFTVSSTLLHNYRCEETLTNRIRHQAANN